MQRIFFFLLIIGMFISAETAIGSCLRFSEDGQSCQECIQNYHNHEGKCYVDILGCLDYRSGNICHQCDRNYILVNNMCCDVVCMSKIFSRFKKSVKQETIANNSQILSSLIPFANQKYIQERAGRLVAIEVKEFSAVRRFFLLYEFFDSRFYSKRLIVDYLLENKRLVAVDWSLTRNSWRYAQIQWKEVENDAETLTLFPNLYLADHSFEEVVVRRAVLSQVAQYQIATRDGQNSTLRVLYSQQQGPVILRESVESVKITKNQDEKMSNDISVFTAYEKHYEGETIRQEAKINEALEACLELVRQHEKFQHVFTYVTEAGRVKGLIEFTIVGENHTQNSIIKFVVEYSIKKQSPFIISSSEEGTTTETHQFTQTQQQPQNTSKSQQTDKTEQNVSLETNNVVIMEDSISTHTVYLPPLSPELQAITDRLKEIYNQDQIRKYAEQHGMNYSQLGNLSNPTIMSGTRIFRRMVTSETCSGSPWAEVAYVQTENVNDTVQFFTYYLEERFANGSKTWYPLGEKQKNQSQQVYANPTGYPVNTVDPSFINSPNISFFSTDQGSFKNELNATNSSAYSVYVGLAANTSTQSKRNMSDIKRFAIDVKNSTDVYRAMGLRVDTHPYPLLKDYISIFCHENLLMPSITIGINKTAPTTEVSHDYKGDTTVQTENIQRMVKEDQVLRKLLQWAQIQKPILKQYNLSRVRVSEYEWSLEYHLFFEEINLQGQEGISSQIQLVVVYMKETNSFQFVSFAINESLNETNSQQNGTEVHSNSGNNKDFVIIDTTTEKDYSTQEPIANESEVHVPTHQELIKMNREERVQQIIDSVLRLLEVEHKLILPHIIKAFKQINEHENIIKFDLIVAAGAPSLNYSVVVIGELDSQKDPIIEQIKAIPHQIVEKLENITMQKTGKCQKTNDGVSSQEPCLEQGTSGEVDIIPQTTEQQTTFKKDNNSQQKPSEEVVSMVDEVTFQETVTVSNEVRKIQVNPNTEGLSQEIKEILDQVSQKQQLIASSNEQSTALQVKILSIEEAATKVYAHISITIRVRYSSRTVIRRHFFIRFLQNSHQQTYMGFENLPADFQAFKERVFRNLTVLKNDEENHEKYMEVFSFVSHETEQNFEVSQMNGIFYRVFPSGWYIRVSFQGTHEVHRAHLIEKDGHFELMKWRTIPNETPVQPTEKTETHSQAQKELESTIDYQQKTTPQEVIISLSLEEKLAEVLHYLSAQKQQQLAGSSLQQYAFVEDKGFDGIVKSIQFDLYFIKFVDQTHIIEYICSAIRQESKGSIQVVLFLENEIYLGDTNTEPSSEESQTSTVGQKVIQEQKKENTDFEIVDPNQMHYSSAISLVEQDQQENFVSVVDLEATLPTALSDVVRFLRVKYTIISQSAVLRVTMTQKTSHLQRYTVYFFKQMASYYEVYKAVADYSTATSQQRIHMVSFSLYASKNQLTTSAVKDLSLEADTDIAYGYQPIDMEQISKDENVQNILKFISERYSPIVVDKKVVKVEHLSLNDGRINYKVVYLGTDGSEFKFLVFYQPQLQKVLVLNSVNLPQHSHYNQLSSAEQKQDSLLTSQILPFINSLHPEIDGFLIRTISKSQNEYNLVLQKNSKKYRSLVKVAANKADLEEISFSQLAEISLDHYRLDQLEELFIMNYQKLTQEELLAQSKSRMVIQHLLDTQPATEKSQILGAAFKPSKLGFLYQLFFKLRNSELAVAQVYIETFSNKLTTKSFHKLTFVQEDMIQVNLQDLAVKKLLGFLKKQVQSAFTSKTAFARDFLFGTLYKIDIQQENLPTQEFFIYHDHSTEQVNILFERQSENEDQCVYEQGHCNNCKSSAYFSQDNACHQKIEGCLEQKGQNCQVCNAESSLVNGICIKKAVCGALCQAINLQQVQE